MSPQSNKDLSRAYFAHADSGDHAAWRAALAPDVTVQVNGDAEMTLDQFAGMAAAFGAAFSNGRHLIDAQLAEGDWVTSRGYWTAVHTAPFHGVPASNRPVRVFCVANHRFKDGKIVESRTSIDVMALMQQIGAIPVAA